MDITLALGGGGVKGYAHIGVLRALERGKFNIRAIAGTSAGGLMGSAYCAGFSLDEIQDRLVKVDQAKLYNRLPGDGPSLLGVGGILETLKAFLGDRTFDQLTIPFAVTAVDLNSGQEIILDSGRVLDAILATIAVPGIFPPRASDGRLLVDGGVLDPVPVLLARKLAPGMPVVAVVLSPPIREWDGKIPAPRLLSSLPLLNRLYEMRLAQSLNIFLRSVDVAGCLLTDMRLKRDRPEVIIRPAIGAYGLLDRVDIAKVIQLGDEAGTSALPSLIRVFDWKYKLAQKLPWLSDFLRMEAYDP
jgi:NTE family protein